MDEQTRNMRPVLIPKFKLWISTERDEGVFGDGKYRLLKAIEACGSLRSAVETMGMSYRKGWGDLKKAERILGVQLIDRKRGGKSGGGTTLTESGRRWIWAYERFRKNLEAKAREDFQIVLEEVFSGNNTEIGETNEKND